MRSLSQTTYIVAANNSELLENAVKQAGYAAKRVIAVNYSKSGEKLAHECQAIVTEDEGFVMALSRSYGKESVIKIDAMRNAEILFVDNRPSEWLGEFKTTETVPTGDYIYDAATNIVYICVR
jgi:hypothetical protein